VNMGLDLYRVESTFRVQVNHCSELLIPQLKIDLRDLLYPGE
jgi:bacillaene synthase trans-acting acyltransferase